MRISEVDNRNTDKGGSSEEAYEFFIKVKVPGLNHGWEND